MKEPGRLAFLFLTMASCFVLNWGCDVQRDHREGNDSEKINPPDARTPTPGDLQPFELVIRNPLGMSMVLIPRGPFQMGSARPELFGDYSRCEGPQHFVRLSQDFRISQHEITVRQFRRFVESTGYVTDAERTTSGCNGLDLATGQVVRRADCVWRSPGFPQTDEHPVVCVSWKDAHEFCQWLSTMTSQRYRMPTEAEWEYCCRAGTNTLFFPGDESESLKPAGNVGDQSLRIQCASLNSVADWDDGFAFTAPVGSFLPNRFGLHDMHGNVGEWCHDWFDADYYASSPTEDPTGPATNRQWRVVRGGSWYNNPVSCRSSGRHDGVSTEASTTNGFRVVMEIPLIPLRD